MNAESRCWTRCLRNHDFPQDPLEVRQSARLLLNLHDLAHLLLGRFGSALQSIVHDVFGSPTRRSVLRAAARSGLARSEPPRPCPSVLPRPARLLQWTCATRPWPVPACPNHAVRAASGGHELAV